MDVVPVYWWTLVGARQTQRPRGTAPSVCVGRGKETKHYPRKSVPDQGKQESRLGQGEARELRTPDASANAVSRSALGNAASAFTRA
jgi:hypothetical protein